MMMMNARGGEEERRRRRASEDGLCNSLKKCTRDHLLALSLLLSFPLQQQVLVKEHSPECSFFMSRRKYSNIESGADHKHRIIMIIPCSTASSHPSLPRDDFIRRRHLLPPLISCSLGFILISSSSLRLSQRSIPERRPFKVLAFLNPRVERKKKKRRK